MAYQAVEEIMPYKNPTGYTKPYVRVETNLWNPEPVSSYKDGGKIKKYEKGGVVYTDKNDKDTVIKHKDLKK